MNTNKLKLQKKLTQKRTLFSEVKLEFNRKQDNINKTFHFKDYITKTECTAYFCGKEKIEQKAYICLKCDKKGKHYICDYCYKTCHKNCRNNLALLIKSEYLNIQRFSCYCGVYIKHSLRDIEPIRKISCTMMQLDQVLNILPYHCITHNSIVCCICAVVCHKKCNIEKINEIDNELNCECNSDYHSNFNELALTFPLEQYKKVAHIDIWPIQILNILFSTKSTFSKMSLFFHRALNNEIDFSDPTKNIAVINKFEKLLELFSDSFNRKFKTYYYDEEMSRMFPFENLFNFIKNFEVTNEQTAIMKFRLLFILLFLHFRKDFNTIKAFTSNDFYCNTILERLIFKKILKSDIIFLYNINEKYKLDVNNSVKRFVLIGICNLITKGMRYVSIEENQDELEIGLKLITFMLKRMIFDKSDIILLIDSIYDFHTNFYNYIMIEQNNIYSLIDIFNTIIEICFIITIYYNDLIIEEYLNNKKTKKIGKFIHTKSDQSNKLLTILLNNCDLISMHFNILVKPNLDKKSKEEKRRENNIRMHKLALQNQIINRTTGVRTKIPDNGGLFMDKVINLFIENLSLFSLADNIYQKQLDNITNEDINNYYSFCEKIDNKDFYEIMNIEEGKHHSNILYNLKVVIDEVYNDLFTTSYIKQQDTLEQRLRTSILNACDEININIDKFKKKSHYKSLLHAFKRNEERKKNKSNFIMEQDENLKRKILKEISPNINFAKNNFLLIEEGREIIVDNLIVSQIDEILFKGMFFLSNTHYPNIITQDLIELFFQFLSLFLLTKRGTKYIVTGKNLQVIQKLINRFRFDENNKNINEEKNRTINFNINSIKSVIHFLYNLTKVIKVYNINTIKGHKVLMKYKKSIITHLKYFSNNIKSEEYELSFKKQLKESLEIFNNLFPFYTYNEFELIKNDIIDLLKNSPFKFLNSELFQKLFDTSIYNKDKEYMKIRNYEVEYYFQFFELVTKNSFYVYNNDEYGKKQIRSILEFIDIQSLEKILSDSSEMISYTQKIILLKFVRTYYLIDYLDQVNYLYKESPLSNKDYKLMINNNLITEKNVIQYLNTTKTSKKVKFSPSRDQKKTKKFVKKLEYINELIIMFNIFGNEIERFPYSIFNETNINIKNYIKEIVFSIQEISTTIYYNKDIVNKILPYYYRLIIKFLNKKDVFLAILNDIDNYKEKINSNDYEYLIITENRNIDYKYIVDDKFIIFNKKELFARIIKNIYDIYNKTKLNKGLTLPKYLKMYDIFNEANFPPFSLLEIKDYEYFYEKQNEKEKNNQIKNSNDNSTENNNNNQITTINRLEIINTNFLDQFKNITNTSFLGVLTGDSTDRKIDFGLNFTELFESFINSTEAGNLKNYRTLLCILDKMLFYDCEHIQYLFNEICDKYFFKNLNRELNYYIIQYINCAKRYEECQHCFEITDITKLTIQFLQLLGEGFNTNFHENIFKELSEKRRMFKERTLIRRGTIKKEKNINDEDSSDYSDIENIIINDELIEKSIKLSINQEKNRIKNIPLVYPEYSIYETMINNLKIIFQLMELNNMVEGELSFDKLIILSTNIIDFLIEYIDTKKSLINIIDRNMTNLFFGKKILNHQTDEFGNNISYMDKKGIISIFTMKIEEKEEENDEEQNEENDNNYNRYKLRKIMLSYIKIKYFQLLKAYIQFGNKKDFIQLLLKKKLGPIILFEDIVYYMSELINNLVNKDYIKYQYLLKVSSIQSYQKKLKGLYMYEDDFRTSIELNLIFQICIIIMILEDRYNITMLKEYYDKEKIKEYLKNKNTKEDKEKDDDLNDNSSEDENEDEDEDENKEDINKDNIEKDKDNIKDNINDISNNIKENDSDNKITYYNNNITNNISNTLAPLKLKSNYMSTFNTNLNDNINLNNNNIITLKENPKIKKYKKEEELNKTLYRSIIKNYKKYIKTKTIKKNKEKLYQNKKKRLNSDNLNLKSKFAISVYKFLFSLILKAEIKSEVDLNINEFRKKINYKRLYLSKVSKEISKKIINIKDFDFFLSQRNIEQDSDITEEEIKNVYKNGNQNLNKVKLLEEEEVDNKVSFFVKPYLSFHLSDQTKCYFINNVDRSSAKGKYKSLVIFSDYCLFEMMYNMKFINNSKLYKKLSKISFYYLQVINYILIIVENISLMIHYYKDYSLDYEEYNNTDNNIINHKDIYDIIIIIVIKLVIVIFTIFVWFYFKFILEFQRNILFSEEKTFVFRQQGEKTQNINDPTIVKYFQENGSLLDTISLINKDIDFYNRIKVLFFETILFNLDINIFIFSFVLNLFFLGSGHPIFLSIETLFIVGIFPSLLNIFKSFTSKFSSLFFCLTFTYLIVYVYNWIIIFYMRDIFDYGEIYDYKSGQYIKEYFCNSSIQCLLVLINYGTRESAELPFISFHYNTKMFIGKFICDTTFSIFVITIMGNVTFGLIVDTFGELRDETYNYENDKKNICFICQITRDGCLLKNIDFNSHIKHEHNLWNYINFLIHLHLYNPNDFSRIEEDVFDKLLEKDYGWIPIDNDAGGEEDNDD